MENEQKIKKVNSKILKFNEGRIFAPHSSYNKNQTDSIQLLLYKQRRAIGLG